MRTYKIARRDRKGQQGGECLVYIANSICSTGLKSIESHSDIEQIWLKVMTNSKAFIVGATYRSPSDTYFYEQFDNVLEHVWVKYKNIVIAGGFNCDVTQTETEIIASPLGNRLCNSFSHIKTKNFRSWDFRL